MREARQAQDKSAGASKVVKFEPEEIVKLREIECQPGSVRSVLNVYASGNQLGNRTTKPNGALCVCCNNAERSEILRASSELEVEKELAAGSDHAKTA